MKVVLGFSFGQRGQEPGISNEAIAKAIRDFVPDTISVQWKIGKALKRLGINPTHEVEAHRNKDQYLDTEEVARQMKKFLESSNLIGKDIYVAAHQGHLPRCLRILKSFGIEAKPLAAKIPYNPKSHQIWTRSPLIFHVREWLIRLLYK